MIVAGIGCRRGTSAECVIEALHSALARSGIAQSQLGALATSADKHDEFGILEAAKRLSLSIVLVPQTALQKMSMHTLTFSARVRSLKGVNCLAEAAALAAAGPGARLIAPRHATSVATCALAEGGAP